MQVEPTRIPGCHVLRPVVRGDARGRFVKTVHAPTFEEHGLEWSFAEQYHSSSLRGTVRGLHFQIPPHDHAKLVTCIVGEVLDVALDLRVGSPTYLEHITVTLTAESGDQVYLPSGLAHGFYAVSDQALVHYNVTTAYAPEHDTGVLWSSAGIEWPDPAPLLSDRDRSLPSLDRFESPFRFRDELG